MMKLLLSFLFVCVGTIPAQAQTYTPTAENLAAREEFQDM